jgi:putative ABC transport system permease protein
MAPVARRVYGMLLWAYPAEFRSEFGRAMTQLFADQLADCRTVLTRVRQWSRTLGDVLYHGLAERWLLLRGEVAEVRAAVRDPGRTPLPGDPWWRRGARSLAFAWRKVWQRPVFAVVAILTLALGIGANTAMFSVVNGVLLRPLPFPESDRLVFLTEDIGISLPDAVDWREASETLSGIAALTYRWDLDLTGDGRPPDRLNGSTVEAGLFQVLGVEPLLGRVFSSEEDQVGGPWVAVISEAFWRSRFGADPGVIGRSMTLSDNATEIIGVMPEAFDLTEGDIDLWVPIAVVTPWAPAERGSNHLLAVGRMAPGVTLPEAQAEMVALTTALQEEFPRRNAGKISQPIPLREAIVGSQRTALLTLLGAVGLVLLIAGVNLATLLLVRASSRESEIAVRMALGARRGAIVRQALSESVVLSCLGGGLGLAFTVVGIDALIAFAPDTLARTGEVRVDLAVLGFTVLVTVGTTLVFGMLPGWWSSRTDPASVIHAAGGRATRGQHRLQGLLVAGEMALAFVLLLGAGLMVRSMSQLERVELGFDTNVLTADLSLPPSRYGASELERQTEAFTAIVQRLNETPGVAIAASVIGPPLSGQYIGNSVLFEGRTPAEPGEEPGARNRPVVGDYFRAMGVRLVKGRAFQPGDVAGEPVAIINERFAREYWPDSDPIGQRIAWMDSETPRWLRIIGVAEDSKVRSLRDPDARAVYTLYAQRQAVWQRFGSLVVRSTMPLPALQELAREAVAAYDPLLPVANLVTMESRRSLSISRERFLTRLLVLFAGVALVMAVQGIYGVLAFMVAQRRREIGVRLAMGAPPRRVLGSVVGRAMRLAAIGAMVGAVIGLLSSRVLDSLVFGVGTSDPVTFTAAAVVVLTVALLASVLPGRSALRTNPVEALRAE